MFYAGMDMVLVVTMQSQKHFLPCFLETCYSFSQWQMIQVFTKNFIVFLFCFNMLAQQLNAFTLCLFVIITHLHHHKHRLFLGWGEGNPNPNFVTCISSQKPWLVFFSYFYTDSWLLLHFELFFSCILFIDIDLFLRIV